MRALVPAAITVAVAAAGPPAMRAALAQPADAVPFGTEPVMDDRIYVHGYFDQLEGRLGGDPNSFRWDGQLWAGTDQNRLWIKSEGRVNDGGGGKVGDGDQEVLYDTPVTRYFDLQAGIRTDLDSGPTRTWAALGIEGLAPYLFDLEPTLYAGDGGHYAFRLNASTDLLLTQRLVLQPQIELNAYSRTDRGRRTGSGLSDVDAGLRLRYEITRKLAPYVGVAYERAVGGAIGLAHEARDPADELRLLAGMRVWF